MKRVYRGLIWVSVPLVLIMVFASLLTSVPYMRVSKGLYESHALIDYDHDYVAKELIRFLNYRTNDLTFGANENDTSVLMTENEISHMEDVRAVYTMLRLVAFTAGVIALVSIVLLYKQDEFYLYQTFKMIYVVPAVVVSILAVGFIIDFAYVFELFHLLFFEDNWQFPYNSVLIRLLPEAFWLVSGVIILIGVVCAHVALMIWNQWWFFPRVKKIN